MDMREELYNIMPIANIPSVIKYGILSHNLLKKKKIQNQSVAMEDVQDKRKGKIVPGGRPLHDYANLYFDAHNPMLSRVRDHNENICVLKVSVEVIELPGVVITDRNAACSFVGFYPYPEGLEKLNFDLIYDEWWTRHEDPRSIEEHKNVKCAEVLVPNRIEQSYILGACVYNQQAANNLNNTGFSGKIGIEKDIFFG